MGKKGLVLLILLFVWLAGCSSDEVSSPVNAKKTETKITEAPKKDEKRYTEPPAMQIDVTKNYSAVIETDLGSFTIDLFEKDAPKTVNNFIFLAKERFYDNVIFHRIIKTFMIQTGDPLGDGTGGPGYKFEDELPSPHKYEPGIVAMANAGPDTNGSQFFICTGQDSLYLNDTPNYTIFGKVTSGMDVVQKIANVEVEPNAVGELSSPKEKIHIKSITITEQ